MVSLLFLDAPRNRQKNPLTFDAFLTPQNGNVNEIVNRNPLHGTRVCAYLTI